MHPSESISGTQSDMLKDKKIILCVTGSIAAFECPTLARSLMRHGAKVFAVMSPSSHDIITPISMEWATGNPVTTEITGKIEHISLLGEADKRADLVIIAPATMATIGKIACGIADTSVTLVATTALGMGIPLLIVPAMHYAMFKNPILDEQIKKLESFGIRFLAPRVEESKAKMAQLEDIVIEAINSLQQSIGLEPRDMSGLKVLVTGGPTRAFIDKVRFISNPSSGKMGLALAEEAFDRGAEVTLVWGRGTVPLPNLDSSRFEVVNVTTTEEMLDAVVNCLKTENYDIAISCAAVLDYGPDTTINEKLSSGKTDLVVPLKPLPKVISNMRKTDPDIYLVGFKAEHDVTDEILIDTSWDRIIGGGVDLVVANDLAREGAGFGTDTNEVFIISRRKGKENYIHIPTAPKRFIAKEIFDTILQEMETPKKQILT